MKIAVACNGNQVTNHFGHCEKFDIYSVENNKITDKNTVPNPEHKPGYLPVFLSDLGVNVVIAGTMGEKACKICSAKNIETIIGAEGDSEDSVKRYLSGELKTNGEACHEHQHSDECESHK